MGGNNQKHAQCTLYLGMISGRLDFSTGGIDCSREAGRSWILAAVRLLQRSTEDNTAANLSIRMASERYATAAAKARTSQDHDPLATSLK